MTNRQTGPVRVDRIKDVAVVTLASPPVNLLNATVIAALTDAIESLKQDPVPLAVVMMAEGSFFSAGADLRDLGAAYPLTLRRLCTMLEGFDRPVIAALSGPALGGGAELALAAHYRLSTPGGTIGFPEVTLGLVPGSGATQRLPRLVGADIALRLLLSGRTIPAEAGRAAGLIDGVVNGDLVAGAVAFANGLVAQGKGPRPTSARRDRLRDGAAFLQALQQHRAAVRSSPMAVIPAIIDSVEAALLLPFATGADCEAGTFDVMLAHPQSVALRHLFLAERQISKALMTRTAPHHLTAQGDSVVQALQQALQTACGWLLRQGAGPEQIDGTLCAYGFATGPCGGTVKMLPDPVILHRCLAALMAEGARQVGQGCVARPADIDALAVHGAGFPRLHGGPMRAAQAIGLPLLRRQMQDWALQDPVWAVPPLLEAASKVAQGWDAMPAKSP